MEFCARVESKVNRYRASKESENSLVRGQIRLNLSQQRVFLSETGTEVPIELTPIEFKLLLHLMQNEERVLSREQLLNAVWGNATFIVDRTVDKHVCSLRQKLASCAIYLKTVPLLAIYFRLRPSRLNQQINLVLLITISSHIGKTLRILSGYHFLNT